MSMSLIVAEKRTVSPHRFPLLRAGSLSSRPTTPNSRATTPTSRLTTPNLSRSTSPNMSRSATPNSRKGVMCQPGFYLFTLIFPCHMSRQYDSLACSLMPLFFPLYNCFMLIIDTWTSFHLAPVSY